MKRGRSTGFARSSVISPTKSFTISDTPATRCSSSYLSIGRKRASTSPTSPPLAWVMGVITDEVRSADVVSLGEAMGFRITKADLVQLFIADGGACRKILLNLVKCLSKKLYDTNAEIEKLGEAASGAGRRRPTGGQFFLILCVDLLDHRLTDLRIN